MIDLHKAHALCARRSLARFLSLEDGEQFWQGQSGIFLRQACFLLQSFFDPFGDHRLIMRLAFQLRHRLQDGDQVFRQANHIGRMMLGVHHLFIKIFGLHLMIFRLDFFLLGFRQFAESFFHLSSLFLRLQVPAGENAGTAAAFVLEDQSQPPASVRASIQEINVIITPFIAAIIIIVEETFFRFFRLDAVVAQVLNIAVFFVRIIPFKSVPTKLCRHGALLQFQ